MVAAVVKSYQSLAEFFASARLETSSISFMYLTMHIVTVLHGSYISVALDGRIVLFHSCLVPISDKYPLLSMKNTMVFDHGSGNPSLFCGLLFRRHQKGITCVLNAAAVDVSLGCREMHWMLVIKLILIQGKSSKMSSENIISETYKMVNNPSRQNLHNKIIVSIFDKVGTSEVHPSGVCDHHSITTIF